MNSQNNGKILRNILTNCINFTLFLLYFLTILQNTVIKKCNNCGVKSKVTDLWEPRLQWDMVGLLCKKCFDEKELDFNKEKNFCGVCGTKLGFIRYNAKNHWKICRKCEGAFS